MPPPPQAAEFLPTATAGAATLKWEAPLAARAPSVIPGLQATEWRKVNASMPSLEAISPFMESMTPLIAPIGRVGAAYAALCEALGLPRVRVAPLMRATTVPNNHLSKVMVPVMTTLTQRVPWDRVLDPSTVWVSKGLKAAAFSADVMEALVASGKVPRVLPGWKAKAAQGAADLKMREADAIGDLLNREVAGGGGGALGMGAPTPASARPAGKASAAAALLEAKAHALGAALAPEVEGYEAVFSWPKDKGPRKVAPGERDVASPMAPRNVGGGGHVKPSLSPEEAKAAQMRPLPAPAGAKAKAPAKAAAAFTLDLDAPELKGLKALLADPKRNPFLSADPPRPKERAAAGAARKAAADRDDDRDDE